MLESVAAGSDAHVSLAAEYLLRALQKWGGEHEEARQARAGAARALRLRYGRGLAPELLEELLAARLFAEE